MWREGSKGSEITHTHTHPSAHRPCELFNSHQLDTSVRREKDGEMEGVTEREEWRETERGRDREAEKDT